MNEKTDLIKIEHLYKSFGDVTAVNDLSFKVKRGELFAFLGVNGAGKSTTINVICGQLKKDGGSVEICGTSLDENADEIKRRIGVVFQYSALDKDLSVKDNLESRAALYGIYGEEFKKRLAVLAESLDFKDFLNRPAGKLSGGQRRRVDVARALIHNPADAQLAVAVYRRHADKIRHHRFFDDSLYGGGRRRRLRDNFEQGQNRRGRYSSAT